MSYTDINFYKIQIKNMTCILQHYAGKKKDKILRFESSITEQQQQKNITPIQPHKLYEDIHSVLPFLLIIHWHLVASD